MHVGHTSEANHGAHETERVTHSDDSNNLGTGRSQAGGRAEPEQPKVNRDGGPDDQLGGSDAPRQAFLVQCRLQQVVVVCKWCTRRARTYRKESMREKRRSPPAKTCIVYDVQTRLFCSSKTTNGKETGKLSCTPGTAQQSCRMPARDGKQGEERFQRSATTCFIISWKVEFDIAFTLAKFIFLDQGWTGAETRFSNSSPRLGQALHGVACHTLFSRTVRAPSASPLSVEKKNKSGISLPSVGTSQRSPRG